MEHFKIKEENRKNQSFFATRIVHKQERKYKKIYFEFGLVMFWIGKHFWKHIGNVKRQPRWRRESSCVTKAFLSLSIPFKTNDFDPTKTLDAHKWLSPSQLPEYSCLGNFKATKKKIKKNIKIFFSSFLVRQFGQKNCQWIKL